MIAQVKKALINEFKMKNMGEVNIFLGMEIHINRDKGSVHITQRAY